MSERTERAKKAIEKAQQVVSELCDGTRRWTMSIPAQPNDDPDLVIAGALRDASEVIEELGEAATKEKAASELATFALNSFVWRNAPDQNEKHHVEDSTVRKLITLARAAKSNNRMCPEECDLVAVHTGEGWALCVEKDNDVIAYLKWPEVYGENVNISDLRRAGFIIE